MISGFAGNHGVINVINNAILTDRFPHAIIIEGDEGLGKRTLADLICKSAMCTGSDKPCNSCRNCHMCNTKNHPDVYYIAPEEKRKNITVEQVRKIRSDAYIKPHMGHRKFFIIDKANTMNESSQNALLKVLEEPPKNVIFILITPSASQMLETVVSRCVVLSLTPPSAEECLNVIREQVKKSDDEIKNAVNTARCNIGKALILLGKRKSKKNELAAEFTSAVLNGKSSYDMLKITYPLEKDRVATGEFISEVKNMLADEIRRNSGSAYVLARLVKIYDIISKLETALSTNINLSLFYSAMICKIKQII